MFIGLPPQKLPVGGFLGLRFNPAPGWPPPPPGFVPPPHWQPDPSWPPAPPGWQLWVDDSAPDPPQATGPQTWDGGAPAEPTSVPARPDEFGSGPADPTPWAGDFGTGTEVPPWPDEATGPQTAALRGAPTQAYVPGATGPQPSYAPPGRYPPRDASDPFTRQGPGPGGPPGGPGRGPGAHGKTNGLAVASFVLGLIGITVIGAIAGIVLGILALRQIRRTAQRGRGLAIAGLVLSVLWLAGIGAYLVWHHGSSPAPPPASSGHGSSPTPGPSSPAGHGTGSTNVFSLRAGQCFQNPPASQTVLGVTYVTVVPCSTPHNAQAFVQFTATGTSYPGVAALKRQADIGCHARIKKNVQTSKIKNSMTLHYLYPLDASWASGHKTITCLIVNSKPNMTTSLLRS
jgi:hypothetical protein